MTKNTGMIAVLRAGTSLAAAAMLALASGSALAAHHGEKKMGKNIVETAASAGQFETLIAAAKAAGLAGVLSSDGPFTVFAPTDEAFSALPKGTIESLLLPENKDKLATILKYHVVSGKVGSAALADGIGVDTLAEQSATITQTEGGFSIDNARIVATDIEATNGVIHVIDRVILPADGTAAARMPADAARGIIDMAVNAGVPMFNHGNAGATVALYSLAAQSLLDFADTAGLSAAAQMRLESALRESASQGSARSQAWTLRYALDDVRAELSGEGMRAASGAMTL
jgi:uncharacterized surface protein with fasciclin (FAS1) repeats